MNYTENRHGACNIETSTNRRTLTHAHINVPLCMCVCGRDRDRAGETGDTGGGGGTCRCSCRSNLPTKLQHGAATHVATMTRRDRKWPGVSIGSNQTMQGAATQIGRRYRLGAYVQTRIMHGCRGSRVAGATAASSWRRHPHGGIHSGVDCAATAAAADAEAASL